MQVAYVVKDTGTGMGLGIFAAQDIPKGTMLWKYEPGKSVKLYSKSTIGARLKGLSKKEVVEFLEHVYGWDGCVFLFLRVRLWCGFVRAVAVDDLLGHPVFSGTSWKSLTMASTGITAPNRTRVDPQIRTILLPFGILKRAKSCWTTMGHTKR